MRTFWIVTFLMLVFIFSGCDSRNKDADYFNGEIVYVNKDSAKVRDVTSKGIRIENRGYGMFSVYDSLIVFWNPRFADQFYCIYNVDTEKEVGYFCNKGRGHNEFLSIGPVIQFFKIGNDLKTPVCDFNEQKIYIWNISQSVVEKTTVYDTVISCDGLNLDKNLSVDNLYYKSDNTFLARIKPIYFIEGDNPLPYYKKWRLSSEITSDYHVYKKPEGDDIHFDEPQSDRVYSMDVIKPDGSKIVQAIKRVPQINIIDTKTGETVFYRLSNVSRVSLFDPGSDDGRVYYNSVQADDNYIYATYWGDKQWDANIGSKTPFLHIIHVFNWNGELLYELKADRVFFRIALDPVRNRLYTADLDTDEMYYIDLNDLERCKK